MESRSARNFILPFSVIILSLSATVPLFVTSSTYEQATPRNRPQSSITFTLFGRFVTPTGWGTSPNTVSSPGPDLAVDPGETVTMMLASADGAAHNFGVDYNNDNICEPSTEPCSPNFTTSQISFTFTATTVPGNYTYKCFLHLGPMIGNFQVRTIHDVAVSNLGVSRNFAYSGVPANPIQVNVTAHNPGGFNETFAVYAKANSTLIGNQTITVPSGGSKVVNFQWNTQAIARGTYILTANATRVTGETNFSNNQFTGGTFAVRLKGDVTGDCNVNILDLVEVGLLFGQTITSPRFNPFADLNNDGTINVIDLVVVGSSFGQHC